MELLFENPQERSRVKMMEGSPTWTTMERRKRAPEKFSSAPWVVAPKFNKEQFPDAEVREGAD